MRSGQEMPYKQRAWQRLGRFGSCVNCRSFGRKMTVLRQSPCNLSLTVGCRSRLSVENHRECRLRRRNPCKLCAGKGVYAAAAARAPSHFAAKMKSLSVKPLILCVQIFTPTLPHARNRSG